MTRFLSGIDVLGAWGEPSDSHSLAAGGGSKMTVGKFLIYALHHDSSPSVYVGRSCSGLRRPREHGYAFTLKHSAHLPVVRWINKLRAAGSNYDIAVLEQYQDPTPLNDAECFYIQYFKSLSMNQVLSGSPPPAVSMRIFFVSKSIALE